MAENRERLIAAIIDGADRVDMGVSVLRVDCTPPQLLNASPGLLALTGRTQPEPGETSIWEIFPPEARREVQETYARRAQGDKSPRALETVVLRKDGSKLPVELFSILLEIDGERLIVVFFRDISARKRAEEALQRSEARFRTLVENAPDGIVILKGARIAYFNPAALRLLEVDSIDQVAGRSIGDFLLSADGVRAVRRLAEIETTGTRLPVPAIYRWYDRKSKLRYVEVVSIPMDHEGEPSVLAFARDVTDREAMQARLIESDRLAALGTLAAGVAHEINNPLAYVLFNLEYLSKQIQRLGEGVPGKDALEKSIESAAEGIGRVSDIVRDMQVFARPKAMAIEPVDLKAVIKTVLRFAHPTVTDRAEIACRFDDVPPVQGNGQRLEQLFLNLLLNAADAIPESAEASRRIEIALRSGAEGEVIAEVLDTGVGMSAEDASRVFDPFFTTKPPGKGTGLGLFICRAIVDSLGGKIEVRSRLGEGSCFRVTLRKWEPASAP